MQRYDLHQHTNKTYDEILALLDRCDLSDEEIEDLFANTDTPLIATCRIVEVGAKEAERRLGVAIRAGARFAYLEVEADARFRSTVRAVLDTVPVPVSRLFFRKEGSALAVWV